MQRSSTALDNRTVPMMYRKLVSAARKAMHDVALFLKFDKAWFWVSEDKAKTHDGAKLRGLWQDTLIGIRRMSTTRLEKSTLICFWAGCAVCLYLTITGIVIFGNMAVREVSYELGFVTAENAYPTGMTQYAPPSTGEIVIKRIESTAEPKVNQVRLPSGRIVDFPDYMQQSEIIRIMSASFELEDWDFVDTSAAQLEVTFEDGSKFHFPEYTPESHIREAVRNVERKYQFANRRIELLGKELWAVVAYMIAALSSYAVGRLNLYFVGGI